MLNAGRPAGEGQTFAREMTVARVRERVGFDWADVVFLESAQIYRLSKRHPRFGAILATLRAAEVTKTPVNVTLASPSGDVIEDIS